jgi:cyclic beta-1,2-glucan synthetase
MGSGDWNDGMNRVGHEGRGESVWLGWFLCQIVAGFAPLARAQGEDQRAKRWEAAALVWKAALLSTAWDGAWFKRAYFDNGQPLGSHDNAEARIDLIAQAWSVLSGVAPRDRQAQAMASVEALLVDPAAGLIRLLDPPLANAEPSAGYIQAYPPGVRENGGQYAHAAVWALMASAELGRGEAGDKAYRDFCWLSPAHRSADPQQGAVYGLEPYAMAGDIYSQPPHTGRGGWSWYTGSAAWMHRAAVESIFGLQLEAERLRFEPSLPGHWPEAQLSLRREGKVMNFRLLRAGGALADASAAETVDTGLAAPGPASPSPGALVSSVLEVGVWLDWRALGPVSHFTVPLAEKNLRP